MNKVKCYTLVLVAIATLLSCTEHKDSETFLNIDVVSLDFEYGGGTQTFRIESNTSWTVSTDENWISVNPSQGSESKTITVIIADIQNYYVQTGTIVVRSHDGSITKNITVKIQGLAGEYRNDEDKVLSVNNQSNYMFLPDVANQVDSLWIVSNIGWEIKGPSWIEVWDGSRWRPLSTQSATISGRGEQIVYIRTGEQYEEDLSMRSDYLTISERLTGKMPITIEIVQIGKYMVVPRIMIGLSTGIGIDWMCGSGVTEFYYDVSETKKNINQELSKIKDEWQELQVGYYSSKGNLKESTMYFIESISKEGVDAGTGMWSLMFFTPSSQNQPWVEIGEVVVDENILYAECTMNEFTLGYFAASLLGDVYRTYMDPLLAIMLYCSCMDGSMESNLWEGSGYAAVSYFTEEQTDYHIVTWGMSNDGKLSSLLNRKHFRFNNSYARKKEVEKDTQGIDKISKEEARKSIKFIKKNQQR